jgi:integrase
MANQKITDRLLDGAPKTKRDEVWDSVVSGFGYRKSAKGKAAFFISYRDTAGKKHRHSFGKYPAMVLADARKEAENLIKKAARGESLTATKKKVDTTFATLLERYQKEYAEPRLRTAVQIRGAMTKYALPAFENRPSERITSEDVHNLLHSIDAPYQANRVHAYLSGFFRWCQSQPSIPIISNPVKVLSKPNKELSRDRELSLSEIQTVLKATREMGNAFGLIYEILIRTGLRKGEVASLTWNRVDLEEGTLELKAGNTKNSKPTTTPLPPAVLALLQGIKPNGSFVFSTNGKTPVSGFSKAEKRLKEMTGISDMRVHDFRRTFASTLARLKVQPHIIESCLNHISGQISGVAATYNRYQYFDERKDALLRLEDYLADNIVSYDKGVAP